MGSIKEGEWLPLLSFPLSFAPIPISCVLTDPTDNRPTAARAQARGGGEAAAAEDKANFEEEA